MNTELLLLLLLRRRRIRRLRERERKKKKRFWVREIYKRRDQVGEYATLLPELKSGDREFFYRYLRMSPDRFRHLLSTVEGLISKNDTNFRKSVSAEERLVVTLRFLATGDSQQSLSFSFRLGKSTVSRIISETCDAIYQSLKDDYLRCPASTSEWLAIADDFKEIWNFPHVIGALDGKHIRIECPKNSGSLYYNYKGFYSIVLMAMCDARYTITLFDIGQYGSNNDSGILSKSRMGNYVT